VRVLHIGGSVVLIGGGVLGIALAPYLPPRAGSFGGVCLVLVGILLATPLFAELIARLLAPLTRHLSIEGRLAADNLTRSPGRTGLVIAALAAGVALMFEAAGLTLSSEEAILEWIDQVTAADLFVTCNSPVAASGNSQSMDEEVGRQLAALPLVAAALPVRFQRLDYGKTMIFVTALDAQGYYDRTEDRPWVVGREKFPLLREPGTVLMSENFAVLHHVKVGDTVTLGGPRGPVNLRVVGTVVDYTWNRGTLVLDRQQYVDAFQDAKVDSFDVYLKPGADVNAAREMIANRYAADLSLVVLTRDELRETIRSMVRRLYALSYVQQLLVGLVAGLGVVMALLISVLQRRRELGLLRAVGASRAQVLRSVLAEALLMGLIGALIGLMFGLPLEWYAVRILLTEETGFSFPMRIPWQAAGAVAALALVIATVAGLGPAIHAMRQRIAESIAYE
jgi:putative ABC transport system permease protein